MLNQEPMLEDCYEAVNKMLAACVTEEKLCEVLDSLERDYEESTSLGFVDMLYEHACELAPIHMARIKGAQ